MDQRPDPDGSPQSGPRPQTTQSDAETEASGSPSPPPPHPAEPPPPPRSPTAAEERCVDATSGSFAWLNANGKESISPEYGALNRLGLAMWRRVPPYAGVAQWGEGAQRASAASHRSPYSLEAEIAISSPPRSP